MGIWGDVMIAEINLFGIFCSGMLGAACLAGVILLLVRRIFLWVGFYHLVWHRHLVDLALFTIFLAAAISILPALAGAFEGAS
jgi:hypothetical protein